MSRSDFGLESGKSYSRIILDDIEERVMIGLYPWEKGEENRQLIRARAELFIEGADYVFTAGNDTIISYDVIKDGVALWAKRGHTDLIETYLRDLVALCFFDVRVAACRAAVYKPEIYENAMAGVEVFITRIEFERLAITPKTDS